LLADKNIPAQVIREMRDAGIDVKTATELRLDRLEDSDLFDRAKALGRVLLTLDKDFWSRRHYPVARGGGIIVVDVPPQGWFAQLQAFGFLYGTFARSFGGSWSRGIRARAHLAGFVLRLRSLSGGEVEYEMALRSRRLQGRERTPSDP
jgi:hypothetical protein